VPSCGEEPRTSQPEVRATPVSAVVHQSAHPRAAGVEKRICGTPCHHFGVRQRSLRSCRLEPHQTKAWSGCGNRTRRYGYSSTANPEKQVCATASCGKGPQTPKPGLHATGNRKKILNRGNELKNVLQTHDLVFCDAQNEPIFQPQNAQ